MPPQDPETARWFAAEIQPHGPRLRSWLKSQFPSDCDFDDIIQEAFLRVISARSARDVHSPKAYLYAVARNLALMQVRHRQIENVSSLTETDTSHLLDENIDIPHEVARTQELELLTQAIQSLPSRCRQVLTLRRIYGLSQKEVAAELGITVHTVEIQSAIGLRKIGNFFDRHRSTSSP